MTFARLILVTLLATVLSAPVFAQDTEDAIKIRMLDRVSQVDALKSAGVVGENNKGFLEQRGALKPAQTAVMNAENADRRALYNILAERLHITVAAVGSERATNLRDKSAAGVWLQAPDGSWYKK